LSDETKDMKEITVVIEASASGFGVYSNDLPGITGYGKTAGHPLSDPGIFSGL
jgi:hypothetical protein